MENHRHVFRSAFKPLFIRTYAGALMVYCLLTLAEDGFEPDMVAVDLLLALVGLPLVLSLTFVVVRMFPTIVTSERLSDYSFWGRRRTVEWEQITAAKLVNVLGLQYVRLRTDDGRSPVWVGLFLRDFEGFRQLVLAFAPEGNAFRDFLVTYRG